ncbi:MAG: hypothetical protein OXU75_09275 [Deltaproteobacteria bacterium]|nr:hypothetical protein [Deltaproteobacteria bacterium]
MSSAVDAIIARDEAFLEILVNARTEAGTTEGIVEISLPDGRQERYINLQALSTHIAEVDARIAILKAGRIGAQFVGQVYR